MAHPYHSILPHVNWNVCDISLSNEISFLVYHLISSLNLNHFICYFKCVFRANYNHEIRIYIFLKVNIKLLMNKKLWNTIIRFGRKKKIERASVIVLLKEIKIQNLKGPALPSHAERTGDGQVGYWQDGGLKFFTCLVSILAHRALWFNWQWNGQKEKRKGGRISKQEWGLIGQVEERRKLIRQHRTTF